MNKRWKNFNELDFEMCTPKCSISAMSDAFMNRLQYARDLAGIPFVLNSAYRSSDYDKSKGRTGTGFHTLGHAVDIKCTSSRDRYKILNACLLAGFSGIGIGPTFIHVDDRYSVDGTDSKNVPVIWLY